MRRTNPNNNHGYREAVGGIVPTYAGHRPGARDVSGETAFGDVPQTLEHHRAPGQGWSVNERDTTAFKEFGNPCACRRRPHAARPDHHALSPPSAALLPAPWPSCARAAPPLERPTYLLLVHACARGVRPSNSPHRTCGRRFAACRPADKAHSRDKVESFRSAVGGIKVGYAGHMPGAQNHFGSASAGEVPLSDFRAAAGMPAQQKSMYATEASRQGPRGQLADTHLTLSPGHGVRDGPATPHVGPAAHRTMREGPTPRSYRESHPHAAAGFADNVPRGGMPPREAQRPASNSPTVGYAGHVRGERELTDRSVRGQVEAYNRSGADGYRGTAMPPYYNTPPSVPSDGGWVTPPPTPAAAGGMRTPPRSERSAIVGTRTVTPRTDEKPRRATRQTYLPLADSPNSVHEYHAHQ